jgi:tetratricopeptide (TPR) repeat protein
VSPDHEKETSPIFDSDMKLSEFGWRLLIACRYDEARPVLARAQELAPDVAMHSHRLGRLLSETGEATAAIAAGARSSSTPQSTGCGAALRRPSRILVILVVGETSVP